jgi:hypothetical protein
VTATVTWDSHTATWDAPDVTWGGVSTRQISHGGGRPVHFPKNRPVQKQKPVLTPVKVRIVGHAHAELGPFDAHATAVITRIGVARSRTKTVELASEGDRGWRLRRLQRERDDLEALWLLDGDDYFLFALDDVLIEIARLSSAQSPR